MQEILSNEQSLTIESSCKLFAVRGQGIYYLTVWDEIEMKTIATIYQGSKDNCRKVMNFISSKSSSIVDVRRLINSLKNMKTEWILEDSDRRDDDDLIATFPDWELYGISEGGVTGYGVWKNNEYRLLLECIVDKSTEECKAINDELYAEAMRFGNGQSIGQLALF